MFASWCVLSLDPSDRRNDVRFPSASSSATSPESSEDMSSLGESPLSSNLASRPVGSSDWRWSISNIGMSLPSSTSSTKELPRPLRSAIARRSYSADSTMSEGRTPDATAMVAASCVDVTWLAVGALSGRSTGFPFRCRLTSGDLAHWPSLSRFTPSWHSPRNSRASRSAGTLTPKTSAILPMARRMRATWSCS